MGTIIPQRGHVTESDDSETSEKGRSWYVPFGVTNFAELAAVEVVEELRKNLEYRVFQFGEIVYNITMNDRPVAEVIASLRQLMVEFEAILTSEFDNAEQEKSKETAPLETAPEPIRPMVEIDVAAEIIESGQEGAMVFKDKNDNWRWVAVYSNNYLDADNPPDIISKQAHLDYVERVVTGRVPYPELWHWHIKGSAFGRTDYLTIVESPFDEDAVFMLASGNVTEGFENEAIALANRSEPIGVSHGMKNIVTDPERPYLIISYDTYEISPLPQNWAANPYTFFG